jgi:hypothetical protein
MSSNTNHTLTKEQQEETNKRAALAGQWRTPPLPVFPTSHMDDDAALPAELPDSTEDYAKALQEAYRRGAEAAAAMAAAQAAAVPLNAISSTDFNQLQQTQTEQEESATQELEPPAILPTPSLLDANDNDGAMPPPSQRSMSLPDMTSYGAKQEEEKRQNRLARNRASARLRRLRKKNLVRLFQMATTFPRVWLVAL